MANARIISDMRTCSLLLSGGRLEFVYSIIDGEFFSRNNGEFFNLLKQMIVAYGLFHISVFSDIIELLGNDMEVSNVIDKELKTFIKTEEMNNVEIPGTATFVKDYLEIKVQDGVIVSITKSDSYGNKWEIERNNKFFLRKLKDELTNLQNTHSTILNYVCKSARKDQILKVMLETINSQQKALV